MVSNTDETLEDYLLAKVAKDRLKDIDKAVEVSLDELKKGVSMRNLAEEIEYVENGKKVVVPRKVWDRIIEALEDAGMLKAMDEAEKTPLLTKDEALEYLERLDK